MQTRYTVLIDSPPEQLWRWLEEPDRQKQWMKGLLENVSTSEGPTRVGSTFHLTIQEGRRVAEYDGEITNYDPYRHLGVRFWGEALRGIEMSADYKLQNLGLRTRLDYIATTDSSEASPLMKLLLPLFKVFGALQIKSFLKTLKHLAEAERTQPPVAV